MTDNHRDRRITMLETAKFDFEQRQRINEELEWLTDFPDEAASYIVWLEDTLADEVDHSG